MAKRYLAIDEYIDEELVAECVECVYSTKANGIQKKAAKTILEMKFGVQKANDLVEEKAIVTDRQDALVKRWVKKVKQRDKECAICGSGTKLCAHHINRWSDDPINRINIDNGITLCVNCHRKQHPELPSGLFGGDLNVE